MHIDISDQSAGLGGRPYRIIVTVEESDQNLKPIEFIDSLSRELNSKGYNLERLRLVDRSERTLNYEGPVFSPQENLGIKTIE